MNKDSIKKVESIIFVIRGEKVILDRDISELYGIETKTLKRAVNRNIERFPEDFMFRLTREEYDSLRYHFGTSKGQGKGGTRYTPYAFTEQGIAMLSSILRSPSAIQVNIAIMRTFIKMRRILASNEEVAKGLRELEKKTGQLFTIVFERIEKLENEAPTFSSKRKKIGLKKRTAD